MHVFVVTLILMHRHARFIFNTYNIVISYIQQLIMLLIIHFFILYPEKPSNIISIIIPIMIMNIHQSLTTLGFLQLIFIESFSVNRALTCWMLLRHAALYNSSSFDLILQLFPMMKSWQGHDRLGVYWIENRVVEKCSQIFAKY